MAQGTRGNPLSWVVVGVVVTGFAAGGLGLVLGPAWWLFWVGVGVVAFGLIAAKAVGIMEDTDVPATPPHTRRRAAR